jgi:glutaredoxin
MFKVVVKFLLIAIFFILLIKPVFANDQVMLHIFEANGCPHCAAEKKFLDSIKSKYPQLIIKEYEVTTNPKNLELVQKVGEKLQTKVAGVPFTVIGEKYISGYLSDETTGKQIEEEIVNATKNSYREIVSNLTQEKKEIPKEKQTKDISGTLRVPILGELNIGSLSLPLLTIIVGLLDGFNPCAMWTLLFLITLLLEMKNRKRMWILGTAFIISSGFVYFLFLSAWLNLFLFLGFIVWIRIIIGLIALIMGGYNLKDYFKNKPVACKVSKDERQQNIFKRIRNVVEKQKFVLALGGIILLAGAVNMVELICSAGFPAIFTKILSLSNLQTWQYYLYLLGYIFFYMLDDMVVFIIAMITLKITGVQNRYSRLSNLIGGIIMSIIGLLLLFKPELLMFG